VLYTQLAMLYIVLARTLLIIEHNGNVSPENRDLTVFTKLRFWVTKRFLHIG